MTIAERPKHLELVASQDARRWRSGEDDFHDALSGRLEDYAGEASATVLQGVAGAAREPRSRQLAATSIVDLGSLGLRSPIVVQLEDWGTEYVALWPETESFGSGATEGEAINELKDAIAALYADLNDAPDADLGDLPRRWKRALRAIVVPAETTQ